MTSVAAMELLSRATNKKLLLEAHAILRGFEVVYLSENDQEWAFWKFSDLRLRYSTGLTNCLIASAAHRLQVPLYTHNLKHMRPLLGEQAIKPY